MIKKYTHQEEITLLNIYVPNEGLVKYFKQLLIDIKEHIGSKKIVVADFNTAWSPLDRITTVTLEKQVKNKTTGKTDTTGKTKTKTRKYWF